MKGFYKIKNKQGGFMVYRTLERNEIKKLKEIDNSEEVYYNYRLENGILELFQYYCQIPRFSEENLVGKLNDLYNLYDRGGTIFGAFDDKKLVGIVSLDNIFRGINKDKLQLALLHVDNGYRKRGIGKSLMDLAIKRAKVLGANKLYISGAPKKNTIDFYLNLGSRLTEEIEEDLYRKEPEDIHMELLI